jgi:hypothetical protein
LLRARRRCHRALNCIAFGKSANLSNAPDHDDRANIPRHRLRCMDAEAAPGIIARVFDDRLPDAQ